MDGWSCAPGCECGKHRNGSEKCEPGCECGRHRNGSRRCPLGCDCDRHRRAKCKPGCDCGKHTRSERPAMAYARDRARCPVCGAERALTLAGLVWAHKTPGMTLACAGAGRPPGNK